MTGPLRVLVAAAVGFGFTLPAAAWGPGPGLGLGSPGVAVRAVSQKVPPKAGSKKKSRARKGASKAAAPEDTAKAEPKAAAPAVPGALKFSKDVAPILVSVCTGCHDPRQKRGKLDMSTFEKLMGGTPSEKVIVPGKPEESHLVLRIKGEETPKMPPNNQRTVSEGAIARIEQWVKAGALLDQGLDPKALISTYAATATDIRKAELANLSGDERDKKTQAVGLERWKKANPKANPEITPSPHFLLFGNLPKERAAAALKTLETQYNAVKALLGPASVEWGEKASLYVFNDAGSLGEFVRSTEQREPEPEMTGTSRLTITEPYVAVIDPAGGRDEAPAAAAPKRSRARRDDAPDDSGAGTRSLAGLLTEHFVIGSTLKAGKPPRWVSLGLAAYLGSRVEPRSPYYQGLRQDAHGLMEQGWASKANDALGDATKAEDVRAVGFAILEWLAGVDRQLPAEFVKGMLAGQEKLDDVIEKVLNGNREDFLRGSADFIEQNYGAGR